jgi:multidrug efflux pump subunit AcrA (membrane-fusion protein)
VQPGIIGNSTVIRRDRLVRHVVNAVVSISILAACAYGFMALGVPDEPQRKKPARPPGVLVQTIPVKSHQGPVTLEANGVVVPFREISLAAEVRGKVIELSPNLRPGHTVQQGETLVRLDPTEYYLEVQRLKQQQQQVKAELAALDVQVGNTALLITLAEQDLELQQTELKRAQSLVQRGAGSQTAVDAARRAELTSQDALVRLQNQARDQQAQQNLLNQRQALTQIELQRAELDERRTHITAPISGVVVQSLVEEKSYLQPGMTFAVIEDTEAMEVNCSLTLDDMYWIWNDTGGVRSGESDPLSANGYALPPTPVIVRFDLGERGYEWKGVLSRQGRAGLDERTRTVPCRVRVDQPRRVLPVGAGSEDYASNDGPRTLMRGMFVTVQIECTPHRRLLDIPERAIRPGNRVWIASAGTLRVRPVEIISRHNDRAVIDATEGDIHPDDKLIVSPVANVRDGLPVREGGPGGGAKRKGPS